MEHLALDLAVDFEARRLAGTTTLRLAPHASERLLLDTRDLDIRHVTLPESDTPAPFELSPPAPHLGSALSIRLPPRTRTVRIEYATRPGAAALQWLAPRQTAGGRRPFLFTQSQAILARTWVPCQDTPSVRFTYEATVRVPPGLLALMSAENPTAPAPDGVHHFRMPQPIPSYLLALAVGELAFRPLGPRSGLYAEPPIVEAAAWEFADTQRMMAAAERLFGPYRWGRYDLLVLPPSFPFGGMENPRLTFATPTVLAGDRSLIALVAHELAHSWSGNLVTNATWSDFWLNEGVTIHLERRILEELYGQGVADMQAALGLSYLDAALRDLPPADTRLHLDLADRDPDEAVTDIAYEKGGLFLLELERKVGRADLDRFLRAYFDDFAFRPMTAERFLALLRARWPDLDAARLSEWVYGTGLPAGAPRPVSAAFRAVEIEARAFGDGAPPEGLRTEGWSALEWLHFLRSLPPDLSTGRLAALDGVFRFTASRNDEILGEWFPHVIAHRYEPAGPALEEFLIRVGRRKLHEPLWKRLAATPEGLERARALWRKARPNYHPIAAAGVDEIVGETGR